MKILYSLLAILMFSGSAFALTLEDAISLALENNDTLKKNRATVESAGYKKSSAIAPFLPGVNLSYGYSNATIEGSPAGNPFMSDGSTKEATATAAIGFNIFNGLADWNTYKLSTLSVKMSEQQYGTSKQDIILNTKVSYLTYLQAKDSLEVAMQTLTLLESQKRIAETSYQVGALSRSDVLRVDVQLASTQLQVLNAQISMRLAKQQLEYYVGRAIPDTEEVASVNLAPDYPVPDLDTLYQMLDDNRSEMQYAKSSYDAATYQTKIGKAGFLPRVDLSYSYSLFGDDMSAFDGREGNYDSAQALGVTLTWNIFRGLYDMNTAKANAKNEMAASFALSDLRKSLQLQVSNVYQTYFSAREMMSVAEVGVQQAQESYRVMQNMYENSEATTTDLLDASVALNNALIAYNSSIYGVISSIAKIERAVETELLGLSITDPDEQ
jgi:outer membrane protein TolC